MSAKCRKVPRCAKVRARKSVTTKCSKWAPPVHPTLLLLQHSPARRSGRKWAPTTVSALECCHAPRRCCSAGDACEMFVAPGRAPSAPGQRAQPQRTIRIPTASPACGVMPKCPSFRRAHDAASCALRVQYCCCQLCCRMLACREAASMWALMPTRGSGGGRGRTAPLLSGRSYEVVCS